MQHVERERLNNILLLRIHNGVGAQLKKNLTMDNTTEIVHAVITGL